MIMMITGMISLRLTRIGVSHASAVFLQVDYLKYYYWPGVDVDIGPHELPEHRPTSIGRPSRAPSG